MARWVNTVCAAECYDTGAMKAQVSDEGRILSVHGDKNNAINQSDDVIKIERQCGLAEHCFHLVGAVAG